MANHATYKHSKDLFNNHTVEMTVVNESLKILFYYKGTATSAIKADGFWDALEIFVETFLLEGVTIDVQILDRVAETRTVTSNPPFELPNAKWKDLNRDVA